MKRLGISRKTTVSHPQADNVAREDFLEQLEAHQNAQRQIVYLDESGFAHDRPRRNGYAPIGKQRKWAQAKAIRKQRKCSVEELFMHYDL